MRRMLRLARNCTPARGRGEADRSVLVASHCLALRRESLVVALSDVPLRQTTGVTNCKFLCLRHMAQNLTVADHQIFTVLCDRPITDYLAASSTDPKLSHKVWSRPINDGSKDPEQLLIPGCHKDVRPRSGCLGIAVEREAVPWHRSSDDIYTEGSAKKTGSTLAVIWNTQLCSS